MEKTTANFGKSGRKPAVSLEWDKIGPRLLFTNRKLHSLYMRFRLVPKSTTLYDIERPLRTLLHSKVFIGAHHENLKDDRPILSAAKM